MRRKIAIVASAVLLSGCYHATVRTGINAGPERYHQSMAPGWVYGLVSPSTVDAEEHCGDRGVAIVETQHSFVNMLVGGLTFGIFTPMTITVTCGDGTPEEQGEDSDGSPPKHP